MAPLRAESVTQDERTFDERTLDEPRRAGPLGPALSHLVVEQILERADARRPVRTLSGPTPAMSIAVSARAVDLGAGPLAMESLHEVASLAIAYFLDHGYLAVARPNQGPVFLHPLPVPPLDGEELDEVVALCRRLDEEQVRQQVVAAAERFRHATERSPTMRDLIVDVRLGEGMIVAPTGFVGVLLATSSWRSV